MSRVCISLFSLYCQVRIVWIDSAAPPAFFSHSSSVRYPRPPLPSAPSGAGGAPPQAAGRPSAEASRSAEARPGRHPRPPALTLLDERRGGEGGAADGDALEPSLRQFMEPGIALDADVGAQAGGGGPEAHAAGSPAADGEGLHGREHDPAAVGIVDAVREVIEATRVPAAERDRLLLAALRGRGVPVLPAELDASYRG